MFSKFTWIVNLIGVHGFLITNKSKRSYILRKVAMIDWGTYFEVGQNLFKVLVVILKVPKLLHIRASHGNCQIYQFFSSLSILVECCILSELDKNWFCMSLLKQI